MAGVDKDLPSVTPKKAEGGTAASGRRPRRMSMRCVARHPFTQSCAAVGAPFLPRLPGSPEMGVIKPKALLPFTLEVVGTYSCHGVEPGMRQGETSAKINQDRGCVCYPFGGESATKTMALFCVFDGHGGSPATLHWCASPSN